MPVSGIRPKTGRFAVPVSVGLECRFVASLKIGRFAVLLNRRQMQYLLDQEIERHKRSSDQVSLMLMDLDHFKQLNDNHGHDAGDKVLQAFADILRKGLRSQDFVARWGGEEFLVLMPQCAVSDAIKTAERIRFAICRC